MKKINLVFLLSILFCQISQSQIKRQFQDEQFTGTTVVIKENNSSDTDILDSNFDMDMVSMGTVIRITTEKDRVTQHAPKELQPIGSGPIAESATELNLQTLKHEVREAKIVEEEVIAEIKVEQNQTLSTQSVVRRGGGNYPTYSGYQGIVKNRRFRKTKRKRKNRNKCFRF